MKKLLFLASALSVLLLASCSNNYEEPAAPEPLLRVPLNGQPTFLVMQNQSSNSFADIKKSSSNYHKIVQDYIKTKEEKGENVFIPRDHQDYIIDLSQINTKKKNPSGMSRDEVPQTPTRWEDDIGISNLSPTVDKNNPPRINGKQVKRTFYSSEGDGTGTTYSSNCVLSAVGKYCYVWSNATMNDYNQKMLNIAKKFDEIYAKETYIFGSNIPTLSSTASNSLNNVLISIPENQKIHIIVYDLEGDGNKNSGAVLMGYFWDLDFIQNTYLNGDDYDPVNKTYTKNSNECQCIHIDSVEFEKNPNEIYSTLGHEFQHLLHYVNKSINTYKVGKDFQHSDTWFNEMMSMVCEDIMLTQLGLPVTAGPQNRLDLFNQTFFAGFTSWFDGDDVLVSYANAYAFGAFILRNFGIDCIIDMAHSEYINEYAVLKAVQKYDSSIKTFNQLQELFYEVMLYPTSSTKHTLNKSASANYEIDSESVTFNCDAINLKNYLSIKRVTDSTLANALYEGVYWEPYYGPFIFTDLFFDLMSWGDPLLETIGPRGTVIVYFDGTKDIEIPHDWSENIKYITVAK